MKFSDKMKKMDMPKKRKAELEMPEGDELDMGMDMELAEDDMSMPSDEMEAEAPAQESEALASVTDEELMAELKKRGLSKDLDESEELEMPELA